MVTELAFPICLSINVEIPVNFVGVNLESEVSDLWPRILQHWYESTVTAAIQQSQFLRSASQPLSVNLLQLFWQNLNQSLEVLLLLFERELRSIFEDRVMQLWVQAVFGFIVPPFLGKDCRINGESNSFLG